MTIDIAAGQCSCPPGQCANFVDPPESCVHKLPGDVRTASCERCGSYTWHQDGRCLRCERMAETAAR